MPDKPIISSEAYIAQLIRVGRWHDPSRVIAFAFLDRQPAWEFPTPGFMPFSAAQRAATHRAFGLIAEVANLSFAEVPDNHAEPGPANNRITFHAGSWDALVSGSTGPYQTGGPEIYGAGITLNNFHIARRTANEGFSDFNYFVTLHEALHALGLSHPGEYNGPGYNYADHALFQQDTRQYTAMSYWAAYEAGADHNVGPTQYIAQTPLLYDIAALQHLYGANMGTRTGDTVYGFNSNTGSSPFNFSLNASPVVAIWDAGGIDTLDFSGFGVATRIDLHGGGFSDTGELTRNVAIAFGARIENAVGGAGNDMIVVNSAANSLWGGGGADIFLFQNPTDASAGLRRSDGRKLRADLLEDFVSGTDRIDLSPVDANRTTAGDDAFTYIGTGAFTGQPGQVRHEAREGWTHIFADLDGDSVADMLIVAAAPALQAGDFIL